jgi:hypothetical protein
MDKDCGKPLQMITSMKKLTPHPQKKENSTNLENGKVQIRTKNNLHETMQKNAVGLYTIKGSGI